MQLQFFNLNAYTNHQPSQCAYELPYTVYESYFGHLQDVTGMHSHDVLIAANQPNCTLFLVMTGGLASFIVAFPCTVPVYHIIFHLNR